MGWAEAKVRDREAYQLDASNVEIYQTEEGYSRARPLPTKEELKEFYINKYYQNGHGNYKDEYDVQKFNKILYKLKRKAIIILSLFQKKPENFLDIGCGQGYALKTFDANGWDVTGIDFSAHACSIHNPDMADKIIEGDLYDILEGLGEYQIVHMDNVLEHVLDPYKLLELVRNVIKPDGILIIDVPNENSVFHRYLQKQGLLKDMFERAYPDHLSFFNIEGLRNICKRAGFVEMFIGDFSQTVIHCAGEDMVLDNYLNTLPISRALFHYRASAELGFGNEMMGFFTVGS